jgi:predicted lipoprotein with Yx(FWY)xxD motif
VVAILVIIGLYAIFHKSSDNNKTSTTSNTSSSAPAVNNAVVVTKTKSGIGQYLTDPQGNTLYTYDKDTKGVSNCTGACLTTWPAYQDKGSTSNLPAGISTIKRPDNNQVQYTYNGMPLYYFVSDSQGQVTGDGVESFSVAKPSASSSSSSTDTNTNSSSSSSSSSSGYPY